MRFSGAQQYAELYKLNGKYFSHFDTWLDRCLAESPRWLAQEDIAHIVTAEINALDRKRYRLVAYCIMSNHAHLAIDTSEHNAKPTHTVSLRHIRWQIRSNGSKDAQPDFATKYLSEVEASGITKVMIM